MIDNTAKKEATRFVVVREFNGTQSMEYVFGALMERQANENYERWKSDHGGYPATPSVTGNIISEDIRMPQPDEVTEHVKIAASENGTEDTMDIMPPVSPQAVQTA